MRPLGSGIRRGLVLDAESVAVGGLRPRVAALEAPVVAGPTEAELQGLLVERQQQSYEQGFVAGRAQGVAEAQEAAARAASQAVEAQAQSLAQALAGVEMRYAEALGAMRRQLEQRLDQGLRAALPALEDARRRQTVEVVAAKVAQAKPGLPWSLSCHASDRDAWAELLRPLGLESSLQSAPKLSAGTLRLEMDGMGWESLPQALGARILANAPDHAATDAPGLQAVGQLLKNRGPLLEVEGLKMNLGEMAEIGASASPLLAEAVGFDGPRTLLSPLGDMRGVGAGERVAALGHPLTVPAGSGLLGQVLDAFGHPLDGGELPADLRQAPVHSIRDASHSLSLARVTQPLETGLSGLDAYFTCGVGQRLGIFAGSGVGKSTVLGMLARYAQADAVVIGLIGERAREVKDFLERELGQEGRARSIVVVATSETAPQVRVQAALTATALAESLREEGKQVLLLMDSVTRFAQALREVGLSLGEPPATRGYPPSAFAALPRLLERAGPLEKGGSITGFYTVLVEGDDMNEPIADAVRGILDGHIVLSRSIAESGRYPAIDLLASLSRCMPEVSSAEHRELAQKARRLFAALDGVKDLLAVGAYREGTDPLVDQARRLCPALEALVRQAPSQRRPMGATLAELKQLLEGA